MNDLLITTAKTITYWDAETKTQHTIVKGNYYGLTWDESYIYCSWNPPHIPVSIIKVFDKFFNYKKELQKSNLIDVHQILALSSGAIAITNTRADEVLVHNFHTNASDHYNWTGTINRDSKHINSLWAENWEIYVAESGLGGVKDHPPTIQVLTSEFVPKYRIELTEAIHIHNVFIENGILYSCGKFGLIQKNLEEGNYIVIDLRTSREHGFFRGFARSKDFFYIGESEITPREQRFFGGSKIVVLDNLLEVVDVINLKDTGQIREIRIVNDIDFAHNRIILEYETN